jgi:hypothetical protein
VGIFNQINIMLQNTVGICKQIVIVLYQVIF